MVITSFSLIWGRNGPDLPGPLRECDGVTSSRHNVFDGLLNSIDERCCKCSSLGHLGVSSSIVPRVVIDVHEVLTHTGERLFVCM